ncbi:Retrovirus-related Pol polyprotein from transposon RE1 [Vitis vinifera]|uniref:Retrovirus-related Pol polyprotein from transposon RE1 n=1 Tax=Vitis vinifera TaxID=29760 RepID=A0A438JA75_VITVI|nr:Retrovirus-related Pol polyprotein from transposon RE1 [Vitis vinifera]
MVLVPRPPKHNVVGCRWIFKTKLRSDGSIKRHKARLVTQGFSQIHGLDFGDTFSPVVRPATIRIILSLVVTSGWRLHKLDVKNAFLRGFLNEEVYMEQPPVRLILHYLSITPRVGTVYLLLYVDDMVITGSNSAMVQTLITQLSKEFSMKDLGDLHYFLDVEVQANEKGLFLNQRSALQYLTITRSDLSFSVNSICQFMHALTEDHFGALKRILRYVKGTPHHDFNSINNPFMIFLLTLMQIGRCLHTRRSTTGRYFFLYQFGSCPLRNKALSLDQVSKQNIALSLLHY